MRDKLYLSLLICGSLSVGSCSSDSAPTDIPSHEVCVYGMEESYSLSRDESFTPLSIDYNMWVATVYHNTSGTSHEYFFKSTSGSIEMEFAYNTTTGYWDIPGQSYAFPLGGSMDFLSYATLNSAHKPNPTFTPATLSSDSPTISSLTLDFGSTLDGTDPVLFSDLTTVNCNSASEKAVLNFHHALSKIVFYLRTTDEAASKYCRIYNITLNDVKQSGVLTVTPAIRSTAVWTKVGTIGNVAIPNEGNISYYNPALVDSDSDSGIQFGSQLYLPSQLGSSSVTVDITYGISFDGNSPLSQTTRTLSLPLPAGNWLPGFQYTYIFTISLTEISVECNDVGAIIDSQPIDVPFDEIYEGSEKVNT